MEAYRNAMLISPDEVKAISQVNYNVADDTIGYAIRTAQDVYLQDLIGTPLFLRLQELVYGAIIDSGDTIDDEEYTDYATLLDEYIQPYLVAKTAVECLMPLTFKVRNISVSKDSDTNISAASMEELKFVLNYQNTLVKEYATRISQFLCCNKSLFAELDECCGCCGVAPKIGRKFANVGLFLNNKNGCCCE